MGLFKRNPFGHILYSSFEKQNYKKKIKKPFSKRLSTPKASLQLRPKPNDL